MVCMRTRRECFYCDIPLGSRVERDHAPVPRNAGGVAVVDSCVPCHHLKDRMTADSWPLPAYVMACADLVERDLLSGSFATWPTCWDDMSREARILWAKAAFRVHQEGVNRIAS